MSLTTLIFYFRYSLQLMLLVSIFLIGEPRRKYFFVRLLPALAVYFTAMYILYNIWTWIDVAFGVQIPFVLSSIINFTCMFAIILGIIYLCFDIKWINVIFNGTGGYALQHATFCVLRIITYFTGTFNIQTTSGLLMDYLFIRILPYVAVALVFYFYVLKPKRRKGELEYKNVRMILFSAIIFLGAIILNELAFLIPGEDALSDSFTSEVVCKGYSALCSVVSLAMLFSMSKNLKTEHDKYLQERIFEIQRSQYSISKETVELFNIKFHDMKHMIDALEHSGSFNNKDEVIAQLKREVSGAGMIFDTGNKALDTVLMQKSLVCQSNGICFTCMADGGLAKIIEDTDLYVLVANILDNAINAVKPLEEERRRIELTIGESAGALLINCENYCGKDTRFSDGLPVTDGDSRYHGFGTRSIVHTAEKYNGAVRMYQEGDVFHTVLVFPLDDGKKEPKQ